jgi:hypothetical protein
MQHRIWRQAAEVENWEGQSPRGNRKLVCIGLIICVVSLGLSVTISTTASGENLEDDCLNVIFLNAYTNDDGVVNAQEHDPRDNGLDPPYDKAVASCEADVSPDIVEVTIDNGYPSYTCQFWVMEQNQSSEPVRCGSVVIQAPSELSVWELDTIACRTLMPGEIEVESFFVHVEQHALFDIQYAFTIEKTFIEATAGTIGFWRNWDQHDSFSEDQIESWLAQIAATSQWLEATTVEAMEAVLNAAKGRGATTETMFLAQYLALRLNEHSSMLCSLDQHDMTAMDPDNYLALPDPHHGSLSEIIAAIESKHGTNPMECEFEIMKDCADALNNLDN